MKFNFKDIKVITHKDKKPNSKKNHVGVEIEFYCWLDRERLANQLLEAGLKDKVKVGYDSSIVLPNALRNKGYIGHEIKIIDTEENIFSTVEKVCEVISKWDAQVNKSCGLHVHLDMRKRDKEICFYNLVKSQKFLYSLNPKYRKQNSYCAQNESADFYAQKQIREKQNICNRWDHVHGETCYTEVDRMVDVDQTRYRCINKLAYDKFRTLEVRVHAGTVSALKINNWIQLLINIVNKKEKINEDIVILSLPSYKKHFECQKHLEKYLKSRLHKISRNSNIVEKV